MTQATTRPDPTASESARSQPPTAQAMVVTEKRASSWSGAPVRSGGLVVYGFFSRWPDGTVGYVESTDARVLDGGYRPYQKRPTEVSVPATLIWVARWVL